MEQLTPKERAILEDQLRHEEVCIQKYRTYAARSSPTLRNLFNEFARDEEAHHQALSRLLPGNQPFDFRGEMGRAYQELAAGPDGQSTPVDTFGRQALWQSTAKQMLFQDGQGVRPAGQRRDPRWGGMLPGDVPDTNHGDVTRGGLDGRGPKPARVFGDMNPQSVGQFQTWRGAAPPQSRGPVSWPTAHMEAAMEWDGSNESPWADLTSPAPLGAEAGAATMLTDMLMTERFISGTYDAAVFDSRNPKVRDVLQRIQRDEQTHGQRLGDHLAEHR